MLAGSGLMLGLACDLPPPTDADVVNPAVDPAEAIAKGNGDGHDEGSTGGSDSSDPQDTDPAGMDDPEATDGIGRLEVLIHDAPTVAVDEVWIRFDEVKVEHEELGWLVLSDEVTQLDLLSLQNGIVDTLGLAELPVGSYGQIRLHIEDSWVVVGADSFPLAIPSGDASGLKIGSGFQLEECGTLVITLDWDAGAHLFQNPQGYKLSPVIDVESMVSDGQCGEPEQPGDTGASGEPEEPEEPADTGDADEPEGTDDAATDDAATDDAATGGDPEGGSSGGEPSPD